MLVVDAHAMEADDVEAVTGNRPPERGQARESEGAQSRMFQRFLAWHPGGTLADVQASPIMLFHLGVEALTRVAYAFRNVQG